MTRKKSDALDRLVDALVEDVLGASDQEILAEFQENGSDPNKLAADMLALSERSVVAANKSQLTAAKAGAAQAKAAQMYSSPPIEIEAARKQLREILQTGSTGQLTMAARKESELSDADVIGMLEDLRALGVIGDSGTGRGK